MMKNYNGGNWPYGALCALEDSKKQEKNDGMVCVFMKMNGRINQINKDVDCSLFGEKWIIII